MIPRDAKTVARCSGSLLHTAALLCCLLLPLFATAQFEQSCSVSFLKDSLVADAKTAFLYNSVTLQNTTGQGIVFNIYAYSGTGWKLLSAPATTVELAPAQSEIIPLSILKKPEASARWEPITLAIQFRGRVDTFFYQFQVKTVEQVGFVAVTDESSFELQPDEDTANVPLRIRNLGNSPAGFKVRWKLPGLNLTGSTRIELGPKRDTTYYIHLSLSRSQLARMSKDRLQVQIESKNGDTRVVDYTISRLNFTSTKNENAYLRMPLLVELGANRFGQQLSYYGSVSGTVTFSKDHYVSGFYRSEYNPNNPLSSRPLYQVDYHDKRWSLSIGQSANAYGQFFSGTRTAALGYRIGKTTNQTDPARIAVFASVPDKFISASLYGASARYHIGQLTVNQQFEASFDTIAAASGLALTNSVGMRKERWGFSLEGGAGMNNQNLISQIGAGAKAIGFYGGGSLYVKSGHIGFEASGLFGSKDMPGRNRNREFVNASLSWRAGKFNTSVIYSRSYSEFSSSFDSTGQIARSSFRNARYGLNSTLMAGRMGVSLFTGYIEEQTANNSTLPRYKAASFDYSIRISKRGKFALNTLVGYADRSDGLPATQEALTFTTSRAYVNFRFGGVQANYIKRPYYMREQLVIQENLSYGPYVNVTLIRGLQARAGYTVTKFGDGTEDLHNANLGISYASRSGTFIALSGQVNSRNIVEDYSNNSITLTLRKPISIPVPFTRKVYNLKVTLYNDLNTNGYRDDDEPVFQGQKVYIDDAGFLTNKRGQICFRNVENGKYTIDLKDATGGVGVIPVGGSKHEIVVQGNTQIYIAYIRSRLIRGRLNLHGDSLDLRSNTVARYRVTATDTAGVEYSTLTDDQGGYFINLPMGKYIVSLNREAFGKGLVPAQYAFDADLVLNEGANVDFDLYAKKRSMKIVNLGEGNFSVSSRDIKKNGDSDGSGAVSKAADNHRPRRSYGSMYPKKRRMLERKFVNPRMDQGRRSYPAKVSSFESGSGR